MMSWARASGIDVPEFDIFTHAETEGIDRRYFPEGTVAFGVRRFDRCQAGRIHIEDFAQVNGILPFNKYDDQPEPRSLASRINYETLARQILVFCGEADLREFVRRLVFMVLSGNADAHLKNWSLIYPDGRHARLSPTYDLVATVAYPGYGEELALPFHGSMAFEAVSLAGFRRLARALGPERDPETMAMWVHEDVATIMGCREAALRRLSIDGHYALTQLHARLRAAPDSLLQ
jgi:serine/threonine-protein kinase HipA